MTTGLLFRAALITALGFASCGDSNSSDNGDDGAGSRNCTMDACGTGCGEVAGFPLDKARACYELNRVALACEPAPAPTETAPATTNEGCFVDDETGDTYIFVNSYFEQQLPGFTACEEPLTYSGAPACE